jgi:hypothetical protein
MPKLARLRRVPWLLLFEAMRITGGHVAQVTSPADRRRLLEILRTSKGMPQRLSERDRADLRRIASKLDLRRLAASVAAGGRR